MDMDFEDQEDHDEEMPLSPASDTFSNPPTLHSASPSAMCGGSAMATQQQRKPRYRECLKNHALGIGGHAVDGCGEFMPAGTEGTLEALKCAACNCHRNFHRKEADGAGEIFLHSHHHLYPPQIQPHFSTYYRTPAGYLQLARPHPRPLALPSTSGGGGTYSREDQDLEDASNPSSGGRKGSSKKRHRTKFTGEQKERMLELAERIGWRIQKQDEELVQHFCEETGLKRNVFKVWMHNNKHTWCKKP